MILEENLFAQGKFSILSESLTHRAWRQEATAARPQPPRGLAMTADGAQTQAPTTPRTTPLPGARSALILLLAINMFNFLDRQVLASVEPEMAKDVLQGVAPEDEEFWSGWLATAFLVTYMVTALLFGWLAERMSRWVLVGIGVILWSLASGASGLDWVTLIGAPVALAYWLLLLTRCLVGVGEGAYGPVAPTMLADLYPVHWRGKIMAWFYLAIPVGGALGYALGDLVGPNYLGLGWRWGFYLVLPPGVLLGLICFFMREPPRGQSESIPDVPMSRLNWRKILDLVRIRSYSINLVGMACLLFAMGAISYWMPRYLDTVRQPDPVLGMGPRFFFGVLIAVGGLVATLLGGVAGDWLRKYAGGSYFIVSGVAMILGFPMVLLALYVPFPWAWVFIFLAGFSLFFNTAPTNTITANVTHPSVRAIGFAVNILITHLFGDAISPPIVGWIIGHHGFNIGFGTVSTLMLVGGLFWIWGSFYLQRDTELAPTRLRDAKA
jgi:MFS family permease